VKGVALFEYTEGDLKIDNVKIHYYRTGGQKPPIILLHGATDNGLCWTPVAELLAEKYDVIMQDTQGHGFSDRLDKGFTFMSPTNEVAGLVKQLGLQKPIIMGHSMGAGITVSVAVAYPSLPKAIILEDPGWMIPESGNTEFARAKMNQRDAYMRSLVELGKRPLEEIMAEGKKLNPRWSEAELKPWAKSKQQFDPELFAKPLLDPRSYEELVPQIKCPTLLIISDDGIVKKEVAENATRLWKSKEPFKWVQIKGAGHNIRREQFEDYKATLFDFLNSLLD
jgi:N-formylmaleamate deformylase